MHTFMFDKFRIHHHGDYSGECIIVEKYSDEIWAEARTTCEALVELAKNKRVVFEPYEGIVQAGPKEGRPTVRLYTNY